MSSEEKSGKFWLTQQSSSAAHGAQLLLQASQTPGRANNRRLAAEALQHAGGTRRILVAPLVRLGLGPCSDNHRDGRAGVPEPRLPAAGARAAAAAARAVRRRHAVLRRGGCHHAAVRGGARGRGRRGRAAARAHAAAGRGRRALLLGAARRCVRAAWPACGAEPCLDVDTPALAKPVRKYSFC